MKWEGEEKVRQFVEALVKSDEGLLDFITALLSKRQSHGLSDYVVTISWHINLKNVGDFVNVEQIVPRLRKILSSDIFNQLEDRKQLAIRTFLDTYDGKIKNDY